MVKKIRYFLVFCALLSCPLSSIYADEYAIGPDDVLNITVWKEDNLTRVYPVDKDGSIAMTYLNEVKVAGLTAQAAAEHIAGRLKSEGYLTNPVVTVTVKEYHSQRIMVFGAVKKPGGCYLKGKTLVLDLLSQIDAETGGGKMTILRKKASGEEESINVDLSRLLLNGDLAQNIEILGGDKVILSRVINTGYQIYILGEVRTPGPYMLERGVSVLEALRLAGGFTDFANRGVVRIIREEGGTKKTIKVNLGKIGRGDTSQDIALQGGDVLVADKSWF